MESCSHSVSDFLSSGCHCHLQVVKTDVRRLTRCLGSLANSRQWWAPLSDLLHNSWPLPQTTSNLAKQRRLKGDCTRCESSVMAARGEMKGEVETKAGIDLQRNPQICFLWWSPFICQLSSPIWGNTAFDLCNSFSWLVILSTQYLLILWEGVHEAEVTLSKGCPWTRRSAGSSWKWALEWGGWLIIKN